MVMLALCVAVSAAYGADYYMKPGATDLSVAASYTTGSAGGADASTPPSSSDEVWIPAGTFAIAGTSASFTTLSGVKRVRPNDGAVLEFIIADGDTRTFNAPINYNGGERHDDETWIKCYGKVVKTGEGTLILAASGRTKSNSGGFNHDYFTQIDLQQGILKLPQNAVGHMYFGDLTMSEGTTLVTCGNMTNTSAATFTYVRSINGSGTITNETGRAGGQSFSPYTRNVYVESVFRGRVCHPVKLWIQGSFTHYGDDTGISEPITVEENYGHLNDGKGYGVYSFDNIALLGPQSYLQLFGRGGGFHYIGAMNAVVDKAMVLYTFGYPAFIDAGWHGGLTFSGPWSVSGNDMNSAVQKWLVLTGSNEVPCVITGQFNDSRFSGSYATDTYRTIFTQKLGSGTWELTGPRYHGGGFAIEEGTLRFNSIDEKGMRCALGLSTNLTTACSVRDPEHVDYAFSLGSTNASAPVANFEYMGAAAAICTTRPLVLVGKGGTLSASKGRLTFGGVSARDVQATPTLTLAGTGSVVNVAKDISDGATGAKVSVVKDGRGSWALAGNQTFSGDITVKQGNLAIRAPVSAKYANYKWFRLSVAQIGGGSKNDLRIRQISLFDKDGVRQNEDLTLAGAIETTSGLVLDATTDIGPGQAYYDKSASGKTVERIDIGSLHGSLAGAFDGIYEGNSGGCFMIRWKTGSSACPPSPSSRPTWIPITMHLSDSAHPITHFDIQGYANSADYLPTRICLEASHNGFSGEWEEVYSNVDDSSPLLAQNNKGYNQWISDGVEGRTAVSRPLGDGIALLKSGNVERNYFSWFRLSIAKLGDNNNNSNNGDDNIWNVRQIGLYDKYGNRLNSGLTMAEGPTTVNNETRTILGTVPQPGQVGYDASAAGNRIKANYAGELNFCFDDLYDGGTGGRNTFTWLAGSGNALVPWEHTRTTWIPIVMHLASAVELDHFDIETMNNNNYQTPKRLMLEGSVNGVDWYVLYDNATTGEANATMPTQYNWWLSDGEQASNASHARPEGTGFSVAMSYVPDENVTQFPDGMSVQVLPGATLTAENATQTIKSLKVDSAGAGTVDGFTFAEDGTIDVTFADGFPQTAVLPGAYVNCEGLENISRWNIRVNGSPSGKYRVSVKDGVITFVVRGFTVSFR